MVERIYIKGLQKELQYIDRRSVLRWLRNNGVRILKDFGSYKQFVLRDEYEAAKTRNYPTQGSNDTIRPFSSKNNDIKTERVNDYKPQGEYEKLFLSILLNINP